MWAFLLLVRVGSAPLGNVVWAEVLSIWASLVLGVPLSGGVKEVGSLILLVEGCRAACGGTMWAVLVLGLAWGGISFMTWAGLLGGIGVVFIMWACLLGLARIGCIGLVVGIGLPPLGRSRAPNVPRSRTWL